MKYWAAAYGDPPQVRFAEGFDESQASKDAFGSNGATCVPFPRNPKYMSRKAQLPIIKKAEELHAAKHQKRKDKEEEEMLARKDPITELVEEQRDFHHALKFKRALRIRLIEALEDYINEAEHQDGDGYWRQFESADAALADFALAIRTELEP